MQALSLSRQIEQLTDSSRYSSHTIPLDTRNTGSSTHRRIIVSNLIMASQTVNVSVHLVDTVTSIPRPTFFSVLCGRKHRLLTITSLFPTFPIFASLPTYRLSTHGIHIHT